MLMEPLSSVVADVLAPECWVASGALAVLFCSLLSNEQAALNSHQPMTEALLCLSFK